MYLQLARYVAAVGYYCVGRYAEVVGYLLVSHSLYEAYYYVFLPVAEGFAVVMVLAYHLRYFGAHVVLLVFLFELSYGRYEDASQKAFLISLNISLARSKIILLTS